VSEHPHPPSARPSRLLSLAAVALVCACASGCRRPGEAQLRAGNSAAQAGRLEDAKKAFEAAAQALPDDARPRELLGNVLYQLGQAADARAAWQAALERDAASAPAHLGLARLALDARDAGAALDEIARAGAAPDPEREAVKALALLARGSPPDADAALAAADAALAQAELPHALYARGGALLVQGRFSDAQATFEQLQSKFPRSPLGAYGLARLAAAQGRATDALLHLQAAKTTAGSAWRADRVADDPAFAFLSTSEGFLALVRK